MSILGEYKQIKSRLNSAIKNTALPQMALSLGQEIEASAMENVYSYPASQWAMEQRRWLLGDPSNLEVTIDDMSVEIRNATELQSGEPNEVTWVEQGINQGNAGKRPFMDKALQQYIDSGRAEYDLASALYAAGFDVN